MVAQQSAKKGFTLLELLLVIAIIAILAGLILFNLNPAQRLNDSNDAKVRSDIEAIASATALYITDRQGRHSSLGSVIATRSLGHASLTTFKSELVSGGYIAAIPVAPATYSQYTVRKTSSGLVRVVGRLKAGTTIAIIR